MMASDDPSDEEDRDEPASRGGRYPIHDACEFRDVEILRSLIFVPLSDDDSDEDDSSGSSSDDDTSRAQLAEQAAAMGRSPVGIAGVLSREEVRAAGEGGGGLEGKNGGDVAAADSTNHTEGGVGGINTQLDDNIVNSATDDAMQIDGEEKNNESSADNNNNGHDNNNKPTAENNNGAVIKQVSPELRGPASSPKSPSSHHQDNTTTTTTTAAVENKTKTIKYHCPYDLDERDDDDNTPLHVAIHARNIQHVRILLEAGASPHKKCDGSAPIHLALSIGAIEAHASFATECLEVLIRHGADPTVRDDSFHNPLYLACVSNIGSAVKMLLENPRVRETLNFRADRVGGRPLHAAARYDACRKTNNDDDGAERQSVTELLLSTEGIEVDSQTNYGRTPLHVAAGRGNWNAARLLIDAGADPAVIDKRGYTPGRAARKRGMAVPNDLTAALGADAPTRDLIMDPDRSTLILCHELCVKHRTCPPIVRGDAAASEPPPENVRRLEVLIDGDDGILRCGEFGNCKWNTNVRRAAMADVLKVHEYAYVEKTSQLCAATPDHPNAVQTLDADTAVSHWSFEAAMRAAGSVCEAVDRVMSDEFRNAFCAVRPPGHHAGPRGIVTCPNDPDGSHGFCLLNNVAIGAAYARSMYRNDGIQKVAIIDFDVHHGNGTEEIVRQLTPVVEQHMIRTPFAVGGLSTSSYRPWLDENDVDDVFFASTHGYGPRDREIPPGAVQGGWFYPASGKTYKSKSLSSPSDIRNPALSDFLMSQTWARLGDEYRLNCCKIIDVGLSLPAKDDSYHHGLQRLELRDSYRKNIIPAFQT